MMSFPIRCLTDGQYRSRRSSPGRAYGQRAQVVDEGVRPDIRNLLGIPRNRDAPRLPGAADREVLQARRDEASRLVVAKAGLDEVRALVVESEQALLVRREPEEPVLLLDPLGLGVVQRALSVDELRLRLERFAADAVETRVHVLVDVTRVVHPLEEVGDECLVALVGRPDEEVIGGFDTPRNLLPRADDAIGELHGRESLLLGDARDLRRMLVDARQEEGVLSALAVVPHQDVGSDRRVRVPDVGRRVHVVDRCRHVVRHGRQ